MTQRVKTPVFITFEGIEGSGKSTQIRAIGSWLKRRGANVVLTREPGGTRLADRIRAMILRPGSGRMSPETELFLYEVARRDHMSEVILPALQKGALVLCDRFTDATLAYQGYGRGLSLGLIEALNRIATGGRKPDLTFLFDLPVEEGLRRVRRRTKKMDRFDREKIKFHQMVRNGYLTLAQKEKRRFRIIDARPSAKKVFEGLCREMERRLSLCRPRRLKKGSGG